jgi:hypothetical protein
MTHFYPDLQRYSCFRRPDWRWRRAHWLVDRGRYLSRRRDDEETGRAVHYLRALARCRDGPSPSFLRRFGDLYSAHRLRVEEAPKSLLVEAWLLARQPSAAIAGLTGVQPAIVDAFEALLFHCRDRIDARDWVVSQLIGPAGTAAATLKSFAYFGGPHVLPLVLPYLVGGRALFASRLDLTTHEGRREQAVRLAIAAMMLPRDRRTDQLLHKIMLIRWEHEHQQRLQSASGSIVSGNIDTVLDQVLAIASAGRPVQAVAARDSDGRAVTRESA